MSIALLGLWLLNTLFFSSAVFTVKLRKHKTVSLFPSLVYHATATLIVLGLWYFGWLPKLTAIAFGVALLKFWFIVWRLAWYKTTKIQNVATLETVSDILFSLLVAVIPLPGYASAAA